MALNRSKFNALLASIAILGVCVTTGISRAEEPPIGEVTSRIPATPVEDSATAWDKTVDVSADAWDATKEGSAKAWDKTKEVSADAWDATKEGSVKAWDTTKTTVQGWQETKPESETDSNQVTLAPSQSP